MDQSSQGHRLLQIGIVLFLIAVLLGLAIPFFANPRLALSAHLVGLLQGIFLLVLGLLWPRVQLGARPLRVAFWLLSYQGIAAFVANLLAAVWAAGGSVVPMAAGGARGSIAQEVAINVVLRSGGAALIVGLVLVAWALLRRASVRGG